LLRHFERVYGRQEPVFPTDPYEFLVWWHCGYPASDTACSKGWAALTASVGTEARQILAASPARLAAALKSGGMVPELRAERLKQIAARVQDEFGGDLRSALAGPVSRARRVLKSFPGIADPGADRMLLFAEVAPVAAVPSNCPQVLVRIRKGPEEQSYAANYRAAQQIIDAELPTTFDSRTQAYLLLKCHGEEVCKRSKPRCHECRIRTLCAYPA
jgi:endonuclease III